MKTIEFLLLFLCIGTVAWGFTTTTGQGYFTWNGQVISYYGFNPGTTFNLVNGITATDTNGTNPQTNQQAFNSYICTENNNC